MASRHDSVFLTMLAELHSAAYTLVCAFEGSVKGLWKHCQWRVQQIASFAMLAELHYLASCMH